MTTQRGRAQGPPLRVWTVPENCLPLPLPKPSPTGERSPLVRSPEFVALARFPKASDFAWDEAAEFEIVNLLAFNVFGSAITNGSHPANSNTT